MEESPVPLSGRGHVTVRHLSALYNGRTQRGGGGGSHMTLTRREVADHSRYAFARLELVYVPDLINQRSTPLGREENTREYY